MNADPLSGASPALVTALAIRFLLELALLAGSGILAWHIVPGARWPAAILVPLAVAILWGLVLSPRAVIVLPDVIRLVIESMLFLGAGAGLLVTGFGAIAIAGVALWVTDRVAIALLTRG